MVFEPLTFWLSRRRRVVRLTAAPHALDTFLIKEKHSKLSELSHWMIGQRCRKKWSMVGGDCNNFTLAKPYHYIWTPKTHGPAAGRWWKVKGWPLKFVAMRLADSVQVLPFHLRTNQLPNAKEKSWDGKWKCLKTKLWRHSQGSHASHMTYHYRLLTFEATYTWKTWNKKTEPKLRDYSPYFFEQTNNIFSLPFFFPLFILCAFLNDVWKRRCMSFPFFTSFICGWSNFSKIIKSRPSSLLLTFN